MPRKSNHQLYKEAVAGFIEEIKTMSRDEFIEMLVRRPPGVKEYWLGEPIDPPTREEVEAAFGITKRRRATKPRARKPLAPV